MSKISVQSWIFNTFFCHFLSFSVYFSLTIILSLFPFAIILFSNEGDENIFCN
jgi:hypothetical protein